MTLLKLSWKDTLNDAEKIKKVVVKMDSKRYNNK